MGTAAKTLIAVLLSMLRVASIVIASLVTAEGITCMAVVATYNYGLSLLIVAGVLTVATECIISRMWMALGGKAKSTAF